MEQQQPQSWNQQLQSYYHPGVVFTHLAMKASAPQHV